MDRSRSVILNMGDVDFVGGGGILGALWGVLCSKGIAIFIPQQICAKLYSVYTSTSQTIKR